MAKYEIVFHPEGIADLLQSAAIRAELAGIAGQIANEAQATADWAQKGSGGRITGYAEAGFSVEIQERGKRPRAVIKSNADGATATAAHFYTQKRDGVGHLRAALYKFTSRG